MLIRFPVASSLAVKVVLLARVKKADRGAADSDTDFDVCKNSPHAAIRKYPILGLRQDSFCHGIRWVPYRNQKPVAAPNVALDLIRAIRVPARCPGPRASSITYHTSTSVEPG